VDPSRATHDLLVPLPHFSRHLGNLTPFTFDIILDVFFKIAGLDLAILVQSV
jgi:hypothetical protein